MTSIFLRTGHGRILGAIAGTVTLIAVADRAVGNRASLGVLYTLPMVLGAVVLPPPAIIGLAVLCAALRSLFDLPSPPLEALLRFVFAVIAYACSALFVAGRIRTRELAIEHLASINREQELRREVEEQLKILVESSPAAILTLDETGAIVAANRATDSLLMLAQGENAKGRDISAYLPVLADALKFEPGSGELRTAAQCQGRRENGEIFLAHTWFSSWTTPRGRRLAAIVVDSSEEMRENEQESLRQLTLANSIAAAAVFHEVRNLCGAISVISANLQRRYAISQDEDFQALISLVAGLEKVASTQMQSRGSDFLEEIPLQAVLDDLRIVIEPDWREIGGVVRWQLPERATLVLGERHGLLQAFLNLAQNSRRAVLDREARELKICVTVTDRKITIRFYDSGVGVAAPDRLFAPFQPGADGTGLGLYISRAVVRSYGGDLRFEPGVSGSCFAVELQAMELQPAL